MSFNIILRDMLKPCQFSRSTVPGTIWISKKLTWFVFLWMKEKFERTVIKKANKNLSFKFGSVQFLDIVNFLGVATSLDSFLKAYRTSEMKGFLAYEWSDSPKKTHVSGTSPYNEFFSRLPKCNPLDKAYSDYQSFVNSGCSSEEALRKLRVSSIPPTGQENYPCLQQVCKNPDMQSFDDSLR